MEAQYTTQALHLTQPTGNRSFCYSQASRLTIQETIRPEVGSHL